MYRLLDKKEARLTYHILFKKAFGFWDDSQIPNFIFVREIKGHVTAFISGYFRTKSELYIQYLGVVDAKQNRGLGVRFVVDLLDYLGAYPYIKTVSCKTENTNFSMMRILLKCQFIPHGINMSTGKKVFIQWIRNIKE